MREKGKLILVSVAFVCFSLFFFSSNGPDNLEEALDKVPAPEILREHTKEFNEPQVIQVTDRAWVAIGFAIANSILLEGPEGLIIVDTTECEDAAAEILLKFREISQKPIKAIVYTHNHGDHVRGVRSFIEDPLNPPDVIAHELLQEQNWRHVSTGKHLNRGAIYQFGISLSNASLINAGIGPRLRFRPGYTQSLLAPNVVIRGEWQAMTIAGLNVEFFHIPGETQDQMGVWLPEQKIFLPGDNIYKTFPNLYAIRGTPPRDVKLWADSLRKIAALQPEYLIPSHTQPITGNGKIVELLTIYADAIQYIHDQALRYLDMNIHPDEAAQKIKLPRHIANHPYLLQFYGTVLWSVKSVYSQYVGWFYGDPVELNPLTPKERALKMVSLLGARKLLAESSQALSNGELQWSLELVSYVFKAQPSNTEALELRTKILMELASKETSANGRHFYLTALLESHGKIDFRMDVTGMVEGSSMGELLNLMRFRLKAEEVDGVRMTVLFKYTDTNETFFLRLENSILQVTEVMEDLSKEVDIAITTTTKVWKDLILKRQNTLKCYMMGDISIEGSLWQLHKFQGYFDARVRPDGKLE